MGATIWLTGIPSSGKSTLAAELESALCAEGHRTQLLDGDTIRRELFPELGFSKEDRGKNVHRIGFIARVVARAGGVAIVPVIAPYRDTRNAVRAEHLTAGVAFVEVFVDASIEACMERDVKGLYAQARRGELVGLTGFDDPYEPPSDPEVHVKSDTQTVAACVAAIRRQLPL